MNERIKLLAKQADAYAHNRMAEIGGSYLEYHNEKFAELIVRECARSVAWYTKSELAGINRGQVFRANKTILDHFGVEE